MQHANMVSYLEVHFFAAHPAQGGVVDGHTALYNVEYLEHVGKEKKWLKSFEIPLTRDNLH